MKFLMSSVTFMWVTSFQVSTYTSSPFICPAKSDFFVRLQIFLHAGCNFLHPKELAPHAKNDEWGYWCLQIWSIIIHNWHFLEIFVQLHQNNSSLSCIKYIFVACKKLYATCTNKTSHKGKFSAPCKNSTPIFCRSDKKGLRRDSYFERWNNLSLFEVS